jgi:transcriptional regulator with XRE-family HTH domain
MEADERLRLGVRLRELRRLRRLTVRELARQASVSGSMISQIETGKTGVNVGSLRRIASALEVPLAEFFLDEAAPREPRSLLDGPPGRVVRRDARKRLVLPESRIDYQLLTPDLRGSIEFVWIELEPGHPPLESMAHPGEECAIVLSGTMHVVIGDEEHVLEAGDSIAFNSSIPHRIENRGAEKVVQISAITPPSF